MKDVLEIYQRPYDPEYPVVCMDRTEYIKRVPPILKELLLPISSACAKVSACAKIEI
jgi:hypothetical protein